MLKLGNKGFSTLAMSVVASAISMTLYFFIMSKVDNLQMNFEKSLRQSILDEIVQSSFAIAEATLARRMWEVPIDSSTCDSKDKFKLSGTLGRVSWAINVEYNSDLKIYKMIASGTDQNFSSRFVKEIKAVDVSDYLLFSDSNNPIYMGSINSGAFGIVAGTRKVYSKSKLYFYAENFNYPSLTNQGNWLGADIKFPDNFNAIFQADRMIFAGGIESYFNTQFLANDDPIKSMINPYFNTYTNSAHTGVALFIDDINKAQALVDNVNGVASAPYITRSSYAKYVYPQAFFPITARPGLSDHGVDSGGFHNSTNDQNVFIYVCGGANGFGCLGDFTCLNKKGTSKGCNFSEAWPKGFAAWKNAAGLNDILFTSDAEEPPKPILTWDNMEALEEDAKICGAVIDKLNPYEDCPIWEHNAIMSYAHTGVVNCPQISKINLDQLTFKNLTGTTKYSRRVIYLKSQAEVYQNTYSGLMKTLLPNNSLRDKLSFWVVSEDAITLKGVQPDVSSPLQSQPNVVRKVYFNKDVSGAAALHPLNLVFLSPDRIQLISPFHVPVTKAMFTARLPYSGGKIRPLLSAQFDEQRFGQDTFKYGLRDYELNHISIIISSTESQNNPFLFRGLWSGRSSTAQVIAYGICYASTPGGGMLDQSGSNIFTTTALVPASATSAAHIPNPMTSFFYGDPAVTASQFVNGTLEFPPYYSAAALNIQLSNNVRGSQAILTGQRMSLQFSPTTPAGKRDLSVPKYRDFYGPYSADAFLDSVIDLSSRVAVYDYPYYMQPISTPTPCISTNYIPKEAVLSTSYYVGVLIPHTNINYYTTFKQNPLNLMGRSTLGSIMGIEMGLVESSR